MWRRATEEDDEAVAALCVRLYVEDPGPRPIDRPDILRTLRALRQQPLRGTAVVLDLDGRVAGYALLTSFWSNEAGGEVCTVDEVYVTTEERGRGWGTRLFARAPQLFGRAVAALSLEVTDGNDRARRLYERLGFVAGNRLFRKIV